MCFMKGENIFVNKENLPDLIIGDLVVNPPIIQGGMGVRISTARLVAAVSNEGAMGVIASVGLGEEGLKNITYEERSKLALRQMIQEAKHYTNKNFAVNIMCALTNYDDLVKIAIDEKVSAIISGAGLPLHLPALARNSSTKLIPIVSSARAADIILRSWIKRYQKIPDAFVVEGSLAGGHLGFSYSEAVGLEESNLDDIVKDILQLVKNYEQKYTKKIPVIAAGGIFSGTDIARVLKLGASGVQMATRFVCTNECEVSEKYKEIYLNCKKEDIVVILSPVGMPARVVKNNFIERIQSGEKMKFECPYRCLKTCDPYSANYCLSKALVNGYRGNLENGIVMCGANAYRVRKIVPVKDLINELVQECSRELNG